MCGEAEGILLWTFEGLQRLISNRFRFTESPRTLANWEYVKRDDNNVIGFMESEGYIRFKTDSDINSKELYAVYCMWCDENSVTPLEPRSFSDYLVENKKKYNLEHHNKVTNASGRRVWGFMVIEALTRPNVYTNNCF